MAHHIAMVNPERVRADVVEAQEFPELVQRYRIMAVPKTVINDDISFEGALSEELFWIQVKRALGKKSNLSE